MRMDTHPLCTKAPGDKSADGGRKHRHRYEKETSPEAEGCRRHSRVGPWRYDGKAHAGPEGKQDERECCCGDTACDYCVRSAKLFLVEDFQCSVHSRFAGFMICNFRTTEFLSTFCESRTRLSSMPIWISSSAGSTGSMW